MADVMRFRRADAKGVIPMPVDSGTVIEVGDLLFYDTDDVKPATDQASKADANTAQQDFADVFAGVAMDASADGDTADIAVATQGVFEFDTTSSQTFEVFDFVTVDANASGDIPDAQVVDGADAANEGIAYAAKRYGSNTDSVEMQLITFDARQSTY